MEKTAVVATIKPWNIRLFKGWNPPKEYKKYLITDRDELTRERLDRINPRYVFFPHWSFLIPKEIYKNYECVVFHMTNLPFGRGGSPLQNLLIRGIYKTKLSAIRVEAGLDSGPVYMKRDFDISRGSAQEIFESAARIDFEMMSDIIKNNPKPKPQNGKIVVFKRRAPKDSQIPAGLTPRQLYDFIRMLDAYGYPPSFFETGGYRIELSNASFENGTLQAQAKINPSKKCTGEF